MWHRQKTPERDGESSGFVLGNDRDLCASDFPQQPSRFATRPTKRLRFDVLKSFKFSPALLSVCYLSRGAKSRLWNSTARSRARRGLTARGKYFPERLENQ